MEDGHQTFVDKSPNQKSIKMLFLGVDKKQFTIRGHLITTWTRRDRTRAVGSQ